MSKELSFEDRQKVKRQIYDLLADTWFKAGDILAEAVGSRCEDESDPELYKALCALHPAISAFKPEPEEGVDYVTCNGCGEELGIVFDGAPAPCSRCDY